LTPENGRPDLAGASDRILAEEKFRLAVEACPNGMVMTDRDGTMVMVNTEIEQQFGYLRDELIGRTVEMLVPVRLRDQYAMQRQAFNRNPQTRRIGAGPALFGLRKDGSEFPVEVGLTPIRISNGLLVLGVIVDVSERKHVERLKDEFVATVSHELRTPMTSISGSLGLLMGQWAGKLPEPATRLLAIAHKNSQRLVRLIDDILDIEKLEADRVVFQLSRVDIRPLLEQVIESNRGFAESYGVHVRLDDASADGDVNVDPDRLAQVITNLLSNAIKFSPSGDEVLVAVEDRGPILRISVRDHGSGVPADFKSHMFEKFAQADATSSREKGGTGLGLSIVKQIVERLHGHVGFDDAPGGGTIFTVDLPVWDAAGGWVIDIDAPVGATRILLCEDDPDTAMTVREWLRGAKFATDFAYTAETAIERANGTGYAAILVDLKLPDSDGIGLIFRLRNQPRYQDTPIFVVSVDPDSGRDDARSSDLNVLGWFKKPVDFDQLAEALTASIATNRRPHILHVDDDHDVLAVTAHALKIIGDVVSVDSIEAARAALAADSFDLAVLDISLGAGSGLELLPDLRDGKGKAIPVIVFSALDAGVACDEQVQVSLSKSRTSIESLVATVRDRLARPPGAVFREVA
jgi:PAS domain S-box-containing protein